MLFAVLQWALALVLGGALGFLALIWDWRNPLIYWKLRVIQSISRFPIFGDMATIGWMTAPELMEYIKSGFQKGKIKRYVKGNMLGIPCVTLLHPDDAEAVLGGTANTKKGIEYFSLKPWLREGLLLSYGKKWRQRRKLLTPTFHYRILEDNVAQIRQHSTTFVKKLLATSGRPVDLEDMVKLLTLDVICETAMGIKLNAQRDDTQSYVKAIKRATDVVLMRAMQIWLIRDWIFALTSNGKMFKKDLKVLHNFSESVIESRREERKRGAEIRPDKRKAFLDILIETDEQNPGLFTQQDIREEVDTFMFEGHDTTSAAITFALYSLANNPEIQERCFEEQKAIFDTDTREPSMEDLHHMSYLEMVIKETLRLYPSVPYISRTITQELKLGNGVILPIGTNAAVFPYIIHRHHEFWDEPEVFRPERFLPGVGRHPYSYIPFSAGPRNCIGAKFAMLEMKTTLSHVIRNCRLEPVTTKLLLSPAVILRNEGPVEVKVFPRNSDI